MRRVGHPSCEGPQAMSQELDMIELLDPADIGMREVDTQSHEDGWGELALDEAPRDPETDVELEAPEDALRTAGGGPKTVEDQSLAAAMEVIDRFHQYQRLRDRANARTAGSLPPSSRTAHSRAPAAPAKRRRT